MNSKDNDIKPPHYTSLSIRNFRGFKTALNIKTAPLTFLVGPNSSGKSSLFDAILLITQSFFSPNDTTQVMPNWGGPLVDLGSFKDSVYAHNTKLSIEIGIELTPDMTTFRIPEEDRLRIKNKNIKILFKLRTTSNDPIGKLKQTRIID